MSEDIKVCVIWKKGATPSKRLVNDANMITDLSTCCQERVSLGRSEYQKLTDHLSGFNELELKSVYYHSECRKPIVNKCLIERLRCKRIRPDSPVPCCSRGHVLNKTNLHVKYEISVINSSKDNERKAVFFSFTKVTIVTLTFDFIKTNRSFVLTKTDQRVKHKNSVINSFQDNDLKPVYRRTDRPTDIPTDRPTLAKQ